MPEPIKLTLATLTTFGVLVGAWMTAIWWFQLPAYILPQPASIGGALWRGWVEGIFWEHALFTLRGALSGFLLGGVAGLLIGIVVAEVRAARLMFYPVVIAIQSMPTVALAPLIVVYLGVGLASKVATVALLCFFPVFVNTVAGIAGSDPRLLDLYRAASASKLRTLLEVKLPSAADQILAGLQIVFVLSIVGCVVSEFVASSAGLGYIIKTFANEMNVEIMFAAIMSLAAIGACFGTLMLVLHRRIVFWRR